MYVFHVTFPRSDRRTDLERILALDRPEAIREACRRYNVLAHTVVAVNCGPAPGRINGAR